jgi:hypothetical protein
MEESDMNGPEDLLFGIVIGGVLAISTTLSIAVPVQRTAWQEEAVKKGYAEFVLNPADGTTKWQWKEPK